jgi:catechol 2,3-dioxygenase-like lactoylglutathione lyase family enzyme
MAKLDHLGIFVRDIGRAREWYIKNLGLKVYGAELLDPDGYLVCLWDERTMREKGGA